MEYFQETNTYTESEPWYQNIPPCAFAGLES